MSEENMSEENMSEPIIEKRVWGDIQRAFDKLKDIDEILYFLRSLVDEFNVCSSSECEIYPKLLELDKSRDDFTQWKVRDFKMAESLPDSDYKRFTRVFLVYIRDAKEIFSYIYSLKTSKKAMDEIDENRYSKLITYLKTLNDNFLPTNLSLQAGAQAPTDELIKDGLGSFTDTNLVQERKKKFQEELSKKNPKKTETEGPK